MRSLLVVALVASAAHADPIDVPGEVIVVHGNVPTVTAPAAKHYNPLKTPPYTDRAINSDAWTRAWMMLDVDETGTVVRVKFLKKPGYDLEPIAIAEAFKQRFSAALDEQGQPMRSRVVWSIEWPSVWWLDSIASPRSAMPMVGSPPHRADDNVPCRGSGPLNLDMLHPVYKDCSKPDLTKADSAPWIFPPVQKH
ncbi:MAG TPA: hypothetical protein VGM39_17305 [Kofleriaceae bacterium]|jgi:hypothetical protein